MILWSVCVMQEVTKLIKVSRAQRGKKKTVTIIIGLKTFGNPS